jgi:hypothetical protein
MTTDEQAAWNSFETRAEVITFAQYMLGKDKQLLEQQQDLLNEAHALVQRAAELLRIPVDTSWEWDKQRNRWLKDAGLHPV